MRSNFFHRYGASLFSIALLAAVVVITMGVNRYSIQAELTNASSTMSGISSHVMGDVSSKEESKQTDVPMGVSGEMRAVWVPYMSLDMSKSDGSFATFQKKFDGIVTGSKEKGMNTLIVQVRPFGDALYRSEYFPWSHILTGKQGVNPGYDPLEYMVKAAHEAGMEIHAWVNPLRIRTKETPNSLSQNNPYNLWKNDPAKAGWTVEYNSALYYNPAYSQVRKLIADGVQEIVKNYQVDGVQFDDYFYPTSEASFDKAAYSAYTEQSSNGGVPMLLEDWRRANINDMVSLVYKAVKAVNTKVTFGISPQGNISNDMKMGADVKTWCSTPGYLDYICPQLYVNFENPTLPFDKGVTQWKEMVTVSDVKLYYGLAVYKAGSDVDNGTWKKSSDILSQQVILGRQIGCDGFMFYSWEYLEKEQTKEEVQNVMKLLN